MHGTATACTISSALTRSTRPCTTRSPRARETAKSTPPPEPTSDCKISSTIEEVMTPLDIRSSKLFRLTLDPRFKLFLSKKTNEIHLQNFCTFGMCLEMSHVTGPGWYLIQLINNSIQNLQYCQCLLSQCHRSTIGNNSDIKHILNFLCEFKLA